MSVSFIANKQRHRVRGSKKVAFAALDAVLPLEKRVLFSSTIAQLETANANVGSVQVNNLEITSMLTQPVNVVSVSGSTQTNSAANGYTFLASDGTGSVEVFRLPATSLPTGYTPRPGDNFSLTAQYFQYSGGFDELESAFSNFTLNSTGNAIPAPPVTTAAALNASGTTIATNIRGYPVEVQNATLSGLTGTTWTTSAQQGVLTDSTGSVIFYGSKTFSAAYSDLVGQTIPTGPVNIVGFNELFGGNVEFYPISVGVPIVTGLSSAGGLTTGGNVITVNGYGFTETSQVTFGNVNASSYTILSDQQISVTVPAAATTGSVNVTVTSPNGTSTTSSPYLYTASPVISSVSPGALPTSGGTVVLQGNNLNGSSGAAISFNGTAGTITSDNGTSITATAPAGSGRVNISVTTIGANAAANSSSAITTSDQLYYGAPYVSSLNVTSGVDSGGNAVILSGTGFTSDSTVTFGGQAATGVGYNATAGTLTVTVPSSVNANTGIGVEGAVDVVVTTGGGSSETGSTNDKYTYSLTTIAYAEANVATGATVTLDSTLVVTQILSNPVVSPVNAHNYTNYALLVTDGTGSASVFGKVQTSSGGTYTPTVGDVISVTGPWSPYEQLPEVGSSSVPFNLTVLSQGHSIPAVPTATVPALNTSNLATSGYAGYLVTLQGVELSSFKETGASGMPTTSFGYNNSNGIATDTSGNQIAIYYDVSDYSTAYMNLSTVNGSPIPTQLVDVTGIDEVYSQSTTIIYAQFVPISISTSTLKPIVSSISPPAQGSVNGGESVTINGYGFLDGLTNVTFGSVNLSSGSYTIVSDNVITATAPPGTGIVDITVTDGNGTSIASSADKYTYTNNPVILSVSPTAGPLAGGNTVVITGSNFAATDTVKFGNNASIGAVVYSAAAGTLTVTAPAEAAGSVDITVSAGGSAISGHTAADTYVFSNPPSISNLNGSNGSAGGIDNGGTSVIITGSGFVAGASVTFGGIPATKVTVNSATQITAISPYDSGAPAVNGGQVAVVVTDFLGSSPAATYTYGYTTIAAAEAIGGSVVVTLDSPNLYVTKILSQPGYVNGVAYNYYAVLVNDGTGSVDLFATAAHPLPQYNMGAGGQLSTASYQPTPGDLITVTGTLSPYNEIFELNYISNVTLITMGTPGQVIPNSAPLNLNISSIATTNLPNKYSAYLIEVDNVTITDVPAGVNQFGSINIQANIYDGTKKEELYYWPSTYSAANSYFNGLNIPTGPVNLIGIDDIYNSNTPEFIPFGFAGVNGTDKFSISTNATPASTTGDPDGFSTVNRGTGVTVTITRSETTDAASVTFSVNRDSAMQGLDYTVSAGSLNSSTGAVSGLATFAIGQSTFTFNITTTTPLDVGDKIFTIALSNASGGSGYVPLVTGGPTGVVIHDPSTLYTLSASAFEENATVNRNGVAHTNGSTGVAVTNATGGLTPDSGLTNFLIQADNSSNGKSDSFGVLTYNDYNNPVDPFDASNLFNPVGTVAQINGVELETTDLATTYAASGPLNVYLVTYGGSIANGSFGSIIGQPNSPLVFDNVHDPIEGVNGQLGTEYLLGTIQYNANQSTAGYTPFNLTNLNPGGIIALENALNSVSQSFPTGLPFRIAVTPANALTTATLVGSTAQGAGLLLQSPIIRINYSNVVTFPGWVRLAPGATATWDGHNLDVTSGLATVIADPQAYGYFPNIAVESGSTLNISTGVAHFGSLTVNNGGNTILTTTVGTPSVLVIEPNSTFVTGLTIAPNGTLDVTDNLVDIQGASLAAVTSLIASGSNNGLWNGHGIISSSAASDPNHLTSVGAILNTAAGGTLYNTFGGVATGGSTDVLLRETYYGDANLDGKVDGSDYTRVDNGYLNQLTSWGNGDFNFDAHIDGSDYTLIDNAFNTQGIAFTHASEIASPSAQLAGPGSNPSAAVTADSFFADKKVKPSLIAELEDLVTGL